MITEPTLFDPEPPIRKFEPLPLTDRERQRRLASLAAKQTSWEAGQSQIPHMTETKNKIMRLMDRYPDGLTSSEVARLLDMDKGSSSKRLGDLEHDGLLVISGLRISDRGRKSSVYRKRR